jgi:23S rRNA (guanine745-N1)-methyltransferase
MVSAANVTDYPIRMNIIEAQNIACPIDGERLVLSGKQLGCCNGHSFDIARQGYVNLLPVQHKRSKQPGDSKDMVSARSQFLNSGIYLPIARKLNELVLSQMRKGKDYCFLDAGCGEGYYLDNLCQFLSAQESEANLCFIGLDISKQAIIQSSRRNKRICWLVGTNRQPPVVAESVDIIFCLFGFASVEAFAKVLKPGGRLILVDPGVEHLKELRQIIYPEVNKTQQSETDTELPGFTSLKKEALTYHASIDSNEQIKQLLLMTPHYYRASKEGRARAEKLNKLEVTVNVLFRVLQKT